MNEQLQNALVEILNKTVNGIDAGIGFMQQQLPDVIEQLLMWYMVKGVILSIVGVLMIVPIIVIVRKLVKMDIQSFKDDTFWVICRDYTANGLNVGGFLVALGGGVSALIGVIIIIGNALDPIQIWLAPKIWLMEYAANLAR